MIQRFLFNGIDMLGNEFAIGMGIKNTILVLPDITNPKFPIRDQAVVTAQEAGNLVLGRFSVKKCFF